MANAIDLASNYAPILDEKYKKEAITSGLEVSDEMTQNFKDAGTVEIMNIAVDGLGDYDRTTGFPAGDVDVTWEPYTIDNDRGKKFSVDSMDDEEAKDMVFVSAVSQFMKQHVIPEVDAVRFAKMASAGTTAVLEDFTTGDQVLAAIDVATLAMDDAEVPEEERELYLSNANFSLLKNAGSLTRNIELATSEGRVNRVIWDLDGLMIKKVPKGRFNTVITLGINGFTTAGTDINFQLVHKPAVKAITRHVAPRTFSAEVNQDADADMYQYRIYHDLIVPTEKTAGVYTSAKTV